jgi:hypothetical protein
MAVTVWPAPMSPASTLSSLKVFTAQHARLVADQAVLGHQRRIEFDLDFYVVGNREHGG